MSESFIPLDELLADPVISSYPQDRKERIVHEWVSLARKEGEQVFGDQFDQSVLIDIVDESGVFGGGTDFGFAGSTLSIGKSLVEPVRVWDGSPWNKFRRTQGGLLKQLAGGEKIKKKLPGPQVRRELTPEEEELREINKRLPDEFKIKAKGSRFPPMLVQEFTELSAGEEGDPTAIMLHNIANFEKHTKVLEEAGALEAVNRLLELSKKPVSEGGDKPVIPIEFPEITFDLLKAGKAPEEIRPEFGAKARAEQLQIRALDLENEPNLVQQFGEAMQETSDEIEKRRGLRERDEAVGELSRWHPARMAKTVEDTVPFIAGAVAGNVLGGPAGSIIVIDEMLTAENLAEYQQIADEYGNRAFTDEEALSRAQQTALIQLPFASFGFSRMTKAFKGVDKKILQIISAGGSEATTETIEELLIIVGGTRGDVTFPLIVDLIDKNAERLKDAAAAGLIVGGSMSSITLATEKLITELEKDGTLTPEEADGARQRLDESVQLSTSVEKSDNYFRERLDTPQAFLTPDEIVAQALADPIKQQQEGQQVQQEAALPEAEDEGPGVSAQRAIEAGREKAEPVLESGKTTEASSPQKAEEVPDIFPSKGATKLGDVTFDQKEGIGSTPSGQSINHFGFVAWITPNQFLSLNPKRTEGDSVDFIRDSIEKGDPVASPFLDVLWDEEKRTYRVVGHEGRGRAIVLNEKNPSGLIPVNILPRRAQGGEARTADFTTDNISGVLLGDENGVVSGSRVVSPEAFTLRDLKVAPLGEKIKSGKPIPASTETPAVSDTLFPEGINRVNAVKAAKESGLHQQLTSKEKLAGPGKFQEIVRAKEIEQKTELEEDVAEDIEEDIDREPTTEEITEEEEGKLGREDAEKAIRQLVHPKTGEVLDDVGESVTLLNNIIDTLPSSMSDLKTEAQVKLSELEGLDDISFPDLEETSERRSKLAKDIVKDEFPEGEANPFDEGLPKGIKATKKTAINLMEVARLLGSQARSAKLRRLMKGVFKLPHTQIQLGDIRWVSTLSHETGHAVDYRLNNNKFPSSVKKRFPNLDINETAARKELKEASAFIRPLPGSLTWDNKHPHIKYRARHTELIADLFSLAVLSPKDALRLAPNMTKALQEKIQSNPEVSAAVDSVTTSPVLDFKTVPRSEQLTTLPPKQIFMPIDPDPSLREQAFDIIKGTTREMNAAMERVNKTTRKFRNALNKKQRSDITAFIEKTGNVDIEGDTFADVTFRMTPEMREIAKQARFELELLRQEPNKLFKESGLKDDAIAFLVDYVPHFWQLTKKQALEFAGKWNKGTPALKKRKLPTLEDGVALGFTPLSTDIAFLIERAAEVNFRAAYTRLMVRRIRDLRTAEGSPVITPNQSKAPFGWDKIDHPVLRHVYAREEGGKTVLADSNAWVHPSITRPIKVLLETPFSGPIAKAVHGVNSITKALNVAFSFFHEATLFESATAALAKFTNPLRGILIGPFEQQKLGITPVLGKLPRFTHQVGHILGEGDNLGSDDAVAHGLALGRSASTDYARGFMEKRLRSLEEFTKDTRGVNLITKGVRIGFEGYNTHLWDNVHAGLKLFTYHTQVAEILEKLPEGVSIKHAKEVIAKQTNNGFGGQEFLELPSLKRGLTSLSEPATQKQIQILHGVMFAPDWTLSNLRVAGTLFSEVKKSIVPGQKADPVAFKLSLRYWRNMILGFTGLATTLQSTVFMLFGDDDDDLKPFPWQNEPGAEWDIDITPIMRNSQRLLGIEPQAHRSYIHTGKQFREVLRYFSDFPHGLAQNLGNKSSVSVRWVAEQSTGHSAGVGYPMPWQGTTYRDDLDLWDNVIARGKSTGEKFLPFSWSPNNFAFSLPKKKGMTDYKAIKYFKQAFKSYADPSMWDNLSGVSAVDRRDAVINLLKEVDDAAKANGIDRKTRKRLFNSARSNTTGPFYRDIWAAIEKEDFEEAEKIAGILVRLGVTRNGISQSAKARSIPDELRYIGADLISDAPSELYDNTLDFDRLFPE